MLQDICARCGRDPDEDLDDELEGEGGATDMPSGDPQSAPESMAAWQARPVNEKVQQVVAMLRLLQKQYDTLVRSMERESVHTLIGNQQQNFDKGGHKV
eukprot:3937625-Rhodomonas_salina.1